MYQLEEGSYPHIVHTPDIRDLRNDSSMIFRSQLL